MSDIKQRIQQIVEGHRVVLFMKGSRMQPMCGFSARAIGVLDDLGVEYETVNVLADPEIRDGIKVFSQWPTIPQLYVDQEFIGGSDIMQEMSRTGELQKLVGANYEPPPKPEITLTPAMVQALKDYSTRNPGFPRLEISPRFEYNIAFGPKAQGDFEIEADGLTLLIDPSSARRANGMKLDYVPHKGVAIENPNEPPGVEQIDVRQLKDRLDASDGLLLFDVRTDREREIASIAGARPLDAAAQTLLQSLPRDTPIAFHCHHGMRSQQAAEHFLRQGFTRVYNVSGGIDAWSEHVDPTVPRY